MTDSTGSRAALDCASVGPARKFVRWAGRLLLLCMAVGFARFAGQVLFPARIEIGPETTVIDRPLTASGAIDYAGALNERSRDGITSDNNAAIALMRAFGPAIVEPALRADYFRQLGIDAPPEAADYIVDSATFYRGMRNPADADFTTHLAAFESQISEAQSRAWTADEFPDVAQWVNENAAALDLIIEGTRRPRFFSPIVASSSSNTLLEAEFPLQKQCRVAANLLVVRSARSLGDGDADHAWRDVLACHRLARLLAQAATPMERLMCYGVHANACAGSEVLLQHGRLTSEQARRCLAEIDALPPLPSMIDAVDLGDRFQALDTVQSLAQDKQIGLDWNLLLRMANRHSDRIVESMREERFIDRVSRIQELNAEVEAQTEDARRTRNLIIGVLFDRRGYITETIGWIGVLPSAMMAEHLVVAEVQATCRLVLLRVGFALAACHADHGAYPAAIDTLVPAYLDEVPPDPFIDLPPRYDLAAPDGYRLYGVGENRVDDGGRGREARPRGDDLVLEVPRVVAEVRDGNADGD